MLTHPSPPPPSTPLQEFKTDDGIPYWYHRVTGQTFWERPLYEDEIEHPLKGGTVLDTTHAEEVSTGVQEYNSTTVQE